MMLSLILAVTVGWGISYEEASERLNRQAAARAAQETNLRPRARYCQSPIVFDKRLSKIARDAVVDAIARWNLAIGIPYFPTPVDEFPKNAESVVIVVPWPKTAPEGALGLTRFMLHKNGCITALVSADEKIKPEYIYTAMRHEFGHVLGMPDSDFDGDLMGKANINNKHPADITPLEASWARKIAGVETN